MADFFQTAPVRHRGQQGQLLNQSTPFSFVANGAVPPPDSVGRVPVSAGATVPPECCGAWRPGGAARTPTSCTRACAVDKVKIAIQVRGQLAGRRLGSRDIDHRLAGRLLARGRASRPGPASPSGQSRAPRRWASPRVAAVAAAARTAEATPRVNARTHSAVTVRRKRKTAALSIPVQPFKYKPESYRRSDGFMRQAAGSRTVSICLRSSSQIAAEALETGEAVSRSPFAVVLFPAFGSASSSGALRLLVNIGRRNWWCAKWPGERGMAGRGGSCANRGTWVSRWP